MPFAVGAVVAVVSLRRMHGRVMEILPGGRYRVAVGSVTTVCTENQLETVSTSKKQQRREREAAAQARPAPAAPVADASSAASRYRSIDLHGMTVPEALAALPPFLDGAIRAGLAQVEIIHGVSGGRLRAAVRDYLSKTPAVMLAAPHERNPGVTVAYF